MRNRSPYGRTLVRDWSKLDARVALANALQPFDNTFIVLRRVGVPFTRWQRFGIKLAFRFGNVKYAQRLVLRYLQWQ